MDNIRRTLARSLGRDSKVIITRITDGTDIDYIMSFLSKFSNQNPDQERLEAKGNLLCDATVAAAATISVQRVEETMLNL
ncbi:hypothetical protein J6590_066111 [Homalodisca vitripennis]|nr:hypothetical protein J6590_066111 [Homalodisca vitripennis]